LFRGAKNRAFLLCTALLFSTGGAAIKATTLDGWQVAGFRSGIAALALFVALPGARKRWTWRTFLTGMAYAATMILFVLANKSTTSANAIFLQSTAPFYFLLLGPLVLKEPVHRVDLVVIGCVGIGAALLLSGTETTTATAPDPLRGNAMALAAGLAWAFTVAGLRWMGKRPGAEDSSGSTLVAGNLIAFIACLPRAFPVPHANAADVGVIFYLGLFQIGLAYYFLTRALREVPGLEASTLLLIEPVFNPIWTWLIHGERPSGAAIGGGLLIIFAAFAGTVWRLKFTKISQLQDIPPPD
jgi:drug/metabolite transporter (DMT)-like permease